MKRKYSRRARREEKSSYCACPCCESAGSLVELLARYLTRACCRSRYGDVQDNSESAINVLLDSTRAAAKGKTTKMDNWADRRPTNVSDVARVLVDLAGELAGWHSSTSLLALIGVAFFCSSSAHRQVRHVHRANRSDIVLLCSTGHDQI